VSLSWYFALLERTGRWLVPGLFAVVSIAIYSGVYVLSEQSVISDLIGDRKTAGIFLLFSLLPAYLLFMIGFLWHRTNEVIEELKSISDSRHYNLVRDRLARLPGFAVLVVVLGVGFGGSQNYYTVEVFLAGESVAGLDVAMFLGNCLLWAVVGFMLSWRFSVSRSMSRLGESLDLDIYRLDKLRPLARLATTEVLVVVGSMAFMPLQSFDANLDAANYIPGASVGIPAAVALFLLPLWGAHKNIVSRKVQRLDQLILVQDATSRRDLAELEVVTAHIERVRNIPNWPIDVQLITRLFVYLVIAPLAWVGAALVERLIDQF